ncbi:phospholipase A and acyltransferase 2-like [Branchiostoma floridae]|uniref:Phospholipase A and acyltransferase 2-like n=1 Tax=Branchiostoma floridae TaxID=7739 RepID=A0A9J7MCR8_BRAFL|nr:phospholipase A and acyltransferase 2-like [Branchiostoma floridae]
MSLDFFKSLNPDERRRNNSDVYNKCVRGDLLKFYRFGYSHWGVFVSCGYVIHRTEDNGTVKIREDRFWDLAQNNLIRIGNFWDNIATPLPGWQIEERARSRLEESGYDVLFKNCENFAKWCRYDVDISGQTVSAATLSSSLITAGAATANPVVVGAGVSLGALAAGASVVSRLFFKNN